MKKLTRDKRSLAEKEIDIYIDLLADRAVNEEDFAKLFELVERRQKLRETKKKVSPDTIAIIAGNLLGIVLILTYEKVNVISTKALNFVIKGRV